MVDPNVKCALPTVGVGGCFKNVLPSGKPPTDVIGNRLKNVNLPSTVSFQTEMDTRIVPPTTDVIDRKF